MSEVEPMINASCAAKILGLHPVTIKEMASQGKLPGVKIGNRWRFRASSLDAWIQSALESSVK